MHFIALQSAAVLSMDDELALAIGLAAYGNPFITSVQESTPPELFGTNTTLRYVSTIAFLEQDAPLESAAEAIRRTEEGRFGDLRSPGGTSAWFLGLRRTAASSLQVVKLPNRLNLPEVDPASFSGGVNWAILERIELATSRPQ